MPGRHLLAVPLLVTAILCAAVTTATADEVTDLIALVRKAPAGMETTVWREKRREAVLRLGMLGDRRAVPVLMEVAEHELFDVAGEHAIQALGKLGDRRAVPVLQRIQADEARDRNTRQLAAKALRQLGAVPGGGGAKPGDDDDDDDDSTTPGGGGAAGGGGAGGGAGGGDLPGGGGALLGEDRVEVAPGPTFPDDILGASEVFTLAAGAAHLSYDSVRDQSTLDGSAAARWERIIEREKVGWRVTGDAAAGGGAMRYQGGGDPEPSSSRVLVVSATGGGEARMYVGGEVYGLVEGALGLGVANSKTNPPGAGNTVSATYLNADLHLAIGAGWGRILDVGEVLRLRRIEKVLERQKLLGRPITGDLAEKVQRAWWALRGEVGAHKRLLATIALLREAGVMLEEPDPSTTYQLLEVLRDGQLVHRPSGIDLRLAVAESYLMRDDDLFLEEGRIETVLASARYGQQLASTVQEIVGEASARMRVLAPDGALSPWSVRAAAAWRRHVYTDVFDPVGVLEIGAEVGASDTDVADGAFSGLATRIGGGVGWSWIPNRASRFRLAGNAAMESGELFVGATFEATYGLLDGVFAGASAWRSFGSGGSGN